MKYFMKINERKANVENDLHKRIIQHLQFITINKGEFLLLEGDVADYFYIILRGRSVALIQPNEQKNKASLNLVNHFPTLTNHLKHIC
jgi:CRP-like cAMP-binding protein